MTSSAGDGRRESVPRRPAGDGGETGGPVPDRWQLPAADPGDPAAWEARLRGLAEAVGELAAAARRFVEDAGRADTTSASTARASTARASATSAEESRELSPDQADRRAAAGEAIAAACDVAAGRLADLAPGLAALDGDAPGWTSPEFVGAATPFHVRVGTVTARTPRPVPAVLPLLGTNGWALRCDGDCQLFVRDVLLRTLAAAEPGRVRLDVVDLGGNGGPPGFDELRLRAPGAVAPVTGRDGVAGLLEELVLLSAQRGSEVLRLGRSGFEDVPEEMRRPGEAYRLVAVLGDPATLPDTAVRELALVAETAGERGVCLLVTIPPGDGVAGPVADLAGALRSVTVSGTEVRAGGLDEVPVTPDAPLPDARVAAAGAAVADTLDRHAVDATAAEQEDPTERTLWTFLRAELGEDAPASTRPADLAPAWAEYAEALHAIARATSFLTSPDATPPADAGPHGSAASAPDAATGEGSGHRTGTGGTAGTQGTAGPDEAAAADEVVARLRRRSVEAPAAVRAALGRRGVLPEGVVARVLLPAPRSAADALVLLDRAERQVTEDSARLDSARAVVRAAERSRRQGRRLLVGAAIVLVVALAASFVVALVFAG